jgi:hypothetical protein
MWRVQSSALQSNVSKALYQYFVQASLSPLADLFGSGTAWTRVIRSSRVGKDASSADIAMKCVECCLKCFRTSGSAGMEHARAIPLSVASY